MRVFFYQKLLLLCSGLILICSPLYASESDKPEDGIGVGAGLEQLSYSETIPDLALSSSDTAMTNWLLFLEGKKSFQRFFIGARAHIPFAVDASQEYWSRAGDLEQTNRLTYSWVRINAHAGLILHGLLNPYAGVSWGYAKQERSRFINSSIPDVFHTTATEEVYSFSALLGLEGNFPVASKWSLTYFAEYLLPFFSHTTNSSLPGWEASNSSGYAYSFSARLNYAFSRSVTAALQISTGRQVWDGSDWLEAGGTQAKWPENRTDFLHGFISIYRYF